MKGRSWAREERRVAGEMASWLPLALSSLREWLTSSVEVVLSWERERFQDLGGKWTGWPEKGHPGFLRSCPR